VIQDWNKLLIHRQQVIINRLNGHMKYMLTVQHLSLWSIHKVMAVCACMCVPFATCSFVIQAIIVVYFKDCIVQSQTYLMLICQLLFA